ncbi:MAG: ParB/RepB/Spo0J family partition protein [Crocinitomicaceae bacterium]|jgi:ParB family chromosome partitioning protein|nr:ParB/RepB/Spo0J family partition protein [Crocinitomicaceae bacterium]MDB4606341.1 ParB/RepB/Spo0J family partition protein [Crocinitomicaceae bacterium]MDG1350035.1 ParB/RepB/Spo0J family partition protein [Crocinitomicaceae bacterium]MDG1735806.1 ParB/RepB/Spo0J family partition protein [Crocinitomicaceae bacterium]MDG2506398.1 ParB/RepB/Spo0J family partition protein [Crocinitomicaceae bacterium]
MNSNSDKKPALGRGLSAILQNSETDVTSARTAPAGSVSEILLTSIETNPFNPRTNFEKEALFDLRESILEHGIIQPLTVRKMGHDKYQLISGERRYRASQLAGLKKVPAYIRIANDQNMLEYALVENIQREDLNAIEIALSYERLLSECELTQEELSEKISKSRSNIANYIRLLKLPSEIQAGLRDRQISMGHARALLAIDSAEEQLIQFRAIIADKLSVRAVEEKVKNEKSKSTNTSKAHPAVETKKDLSKYYDTPIKISQSANGSGKILMNFSSEEEFQRLIKLLLNK